MQKPNNTIFFYIFSFRCLDCKRWEKRINQCKNFSLNWIRPGSGSVKKDSILKHVNGEQHKMAVDLSDKSKMGAIPYQEAIIRKSPIGRSFQKVCERDRDNFFFLIWNLLHARLNSHYEAWSYKKRKHKKVKAYRKSI